MGIVDKKWFKFACPKCETEEITAITDSGSQYGQSAHWSGIGARGFSFVSVSIGSEPDVESATCKACGGPATVQTDYGFGEPKWD